MDLTELRGKNLLRHPWEVSRARAIERLVRSYGAPQVSQVLDFGCGDGFTGRELLERLGGKRYVGFDKHLSAEQCAAWSSPEGRLSFLNEEPPSEDRYDTVLLCDVIEHVADPLELLRSAWARVSNGGLLVVTVPAFQALFSDHDRALKHFRRYSLAELRDTMKKASLDIEGSGYLFGSLLLPRALSVFAENLRRTGGGTVEGEAEHGIGGWKRGPLVTRSLTALLDADNRALFTLARAGVKLPGLTAWAVVHRTSGEQ